MQKYILAFIGICILVTSCKKTQSPVTPLGTNNLTASAALKILNGNIWAQLKTNQSGQNLLDSTHLVSFTTNYDGGGYQNQIIFGSADPNIPNEIMGGSADSYTLFVSGGITYLTITDNVSASSLTDFSTYYKITSINNLSFTVASTGQTVSTAPWFPAATITYEKF